MPQDSHIEGTLLRLDKQKSACRDTHSRQERSRVQFTPQRWPTILQEVLGRGCKVLLLNWFGVIWDFSTLGGCDDRLKTLKEREALVICNMHAMLCRLICTTAIPAG